MINFLSLKILEVEKRSEVILRFIRTRNCNLLIPIISMQNLIKSQYLLNFGLLAFVLFKYRKNASPNALENLISKCNSANFNKK